MQASTAGARTTVQISWGERVSDLFGAFRLDAEAYTPEVMRAYAHLTTVQATRLGDQAFITDGQHGYHVIDPDSPIRHLTARCIQDWFVDDSLAERLALETHERNLRSSCEPADVLFSTAGTLGRAAIVTPDVLPANMDQDIARIHLRPGPIDPWYLVAFLNSSIGRLQSDRVSTGQVQKHVALEKVREFLIPTDVDQASIAELVRRAYQQRRHSEALYAQAEALLLAELRLDDLGHSHGTAYTRGFREAWAAGRFDAEYFQSKYHRALETLGRGGKTLEDVTCLMKRRFEPKPGVAFEYIEIGDVGQSGHADSVKLDGADAPSRAQWVVRSGDVITSTVRPIRRLSALIEAEQDGFVCSSGFAVLKPTEIESEVLLCYLRLPLVCEILDLHTSASMYPAVSSGDLLSLPFPIPSEPVRSRIQNMVRQSKSSRKEASRLVEEAKRRVEEMVLG